MGHELSPYTGWTRGEWAAVADRALAAVRPYASPGHALVDLPGPAGSAGRHSGGLEGFARTFLLAGFRLSQADPGGLAEWYAAGLATGTDPGAPDRWPTLTEVPEARVECASIALALHESRAGLWNHLDDTVRQRVVEWMSGMLGAWVPENNWVWFRAVASAFLRSVGGPYREEDIEHALERTERWYAGHGWYADGGEPGELSNFDYYSGWVMQFYPLWYCRISGDAAESGLADRYRDRLRRYLADAACLVGADSGPLLQGRSLTYRYAMLAPFWAGAVFDATPLSPGQTRRLASGVLRHFVDLGCFDAAGLQPIGWRGRFDAIRQPYTGSGSPYWSSMGFAGLVLPPDHPVWTEVEEPLPIEQGDVARALPAPGWLVSGTTEDGIVRVVNHGTTNRPTRPLRPARQPSRRRHHA